MSALPRRVGVLIAVLAIAGAACGDGAPGEPAAAQDPTTTLPAATDAPATTRAPVATPAPAPTEGPAVTDAPADPPSPADPNRIVEPGDAVSVHYVGTLDNGDQFDSSRERGEVLSFVVASGQMIPGFDAAVQGMKLGEIKNVRIESADAYGEWTEENVLTVAIDQVPEGTAAGEQLFSSTGQSFTVLEVTDTEVTLDGNHRLAGEALNFEIELVSFDD